MVFRHGRGIEKERWMKMDKIKKHTSAVAGAPVPSALVYPLTPPSLKIDRTHGVSNLHSSWPVMPSPNDPEVRAAEGCMRSHTIGK